MTTTAHQVQERKQEEKSPENLSITTNLSGKQSNTIKIVAHEPEKPYIWRQIFVKGNGAIKTVKEYDMFKITESHIKQISIKTQKKINDITNSIEFFQEKTNKLNHALKIQEELLEQIDVVCDKRGIESPDYNEEN